MSVSQLAVAVIVLDPSSGFLSLFGQPECLEIVVVCSQVPHSARQGARVRSPHYDGYAFLSGGIANLCVEMISARCLVTPILIRTNNI